MRKVPHIVRERLKGSPAVTGHPDADILTAFAERSLLEPERGSVLTHLASCAECREILALALPPIDTGIIAPASVAERRPWLTWPAFRWGFATAGVAVIVLGVVQFEHHQSANSAMLAKQVASAPIATEMEKTEAKKELPPAPAPAQNASDKSASIAKKEVPAERRLRQLPTDLHAHTAASLQVSPPALVANKQGPNAPPLATQTVEVQAQNATVNAQTTDSELAQASPGNSSVEQFFGDNSGPLSRAKPADVQAIPGGVGGGIVATPRWSITAVGGLQRSLDEGKTWQDVDVNASAVIIASGAATGVAGGIETAKVKPNVMHARMAGKESATPIFFRAVTAAGNEVWAGGSNATLFHSADGGNHWTRVLPSSSGVTLTGDVVSVEFSDAQHGSVTTSTPEIWTTSDGQTWQKQ
jgi:Photosynthesis system II assembly factor YCF48